MLMNLRIRLLNFQRNEILAVAKSFDAEFHSSNVCQKQAGKIRVQHDGKNLKSVVLRNKIEDHDLQSKLKSMKKWLEKGHTVSGVIQNIIKDNTKTENLFELMKREVSQQGKVDQKQMLEKELRFTISPILKQANEESPLPPELKSN